MVVEFLILIGVIMLILDQVRRIRAASQARITELEAKIVAQQSLIDNLTAGSADLQTELDNFESELKPAEPVEVTPESDESHPAVL